MKKLLAMCAVLVLSVTMLVGCTTKAEEKNKQVLGVIGAMEEEVKILKDKMNIEETVDVAGMEFYKGTLDNKNIVLVRSGVGKVNMATCTQILIDKFNVTALVNSGVAGTMDKNLNQGDIVIST
ncbi:MAG: 5'-methylthioadenosine/S-adenosylhomocysteine nucleosidase, partial [Bacilli bacterium]